MKNNRKSLYVIVAVVVAVLLIGVLGIVSMRPGPNKPSQTTSAADTPTSQQSGGQDQLEDFLRSLPRRDAKDPLAMGDVDAPIVMIEWADYRCPYCSIFTEQTLPQLQHYFDDGKVRFEFRDMPVFGEDSFYAAVAARAAGEQGKYHDFQYQLYKALPDSGHPPVDEATVVAAAQAAGVADLEKFKADLSSDELSQRVNADYQEAQSLGLSSVPAFVVGTQVVQGAQPLENFEAIIAAELEKVKR